MTMKRMKDMKTSILHAFHVLHGLKIKLASSLRGRCFQLRKRNTATSSGSVAVPWNDRLERALKKLGDMAGDLMAERVS